MELKHVVSQDEERRSVTMLLYGGIGEKIDGDYFAHEIDYLGKSNDEIVIRINSGGGSVLQGLSIFNALLNSPAFIVIHIDGVAASMAGVVAMAGNTVRMNDFARLMVHDPSLSGRASLTSKEKKALDHIKDMLNTLLSRRGLEKAQMSEFMSKETWFTAEQALALKLIDEIVPTGKAREVNSILSAVASIREETFTQFIDNHKNHYPYMKVISALFGDAVLNEAQIADKIIALQADNANLQNALKDLRILADDLKAEKEAARKKEIENLVDGAIRNGFFAAEQRETLVSSGVAAFDTFVAMMASLKRPAAQSLTAALNQGAGELPEEKHDFEWYRRNEPETLAEMKILEPERFTKLYDAWEKKYSTK